MRYRLAALLLGFFALAGCGDGPDGSSRDKSYILTTASTGGTYYPVGVGISTLVKLKLAETHNISLSAINSAGSGENIKLMRSGEAQFALVQGLYGVWASTGQGAYGRYGPQLNLRSMTMLWPNVEHFVLHRDYVKTGTLEDLKRLEGAKFAVGNRNSGASQSTQMIFDQLGIKENEHLSYA
ncbi:MAG: TAXI family TRAP transporter solute-binding subunit, partial [Alphaproteobacteria bacterium]|nr:TAXI family TRAP transporter solute-binding subunit [Alphaproteobacteria bacterium]